ncbi:MAG: hypothetical protein IKR48_11200, partial [Kiritimatiellae bacterium]|nr:hypothetical protein [Kiritimatiellia bacterium]
SAHRLFFVFTAMESRRVLCGRVNPRSIGKLFFKLFLLFSFSKDDGEKRRCVRKQKGGEGT